MSVLQFLPELCPPTGRASQLKLPEEPLRAGALFLIPAYAPGLTVASTNVLPMSQMNHNEYPGMYHSRRCRDGCIDSDDPAQRIGNSAGKFLTTRLAKKSPFVVVSPGISSELVDSGLSAPFAKMPFGSAIDRDRQAKCMVQHENPPLLYQWRHFHALEHPLSKRSHAIPLSVVLVSSWYQDKPLASQPAHRSTAIPSQQGHSAIQKETCKHFVRSGASIVRSM
jgi:hypothetical protein